MEHDRNLSETQNKNKMLWFSANTTVPHHVC